jgi:hypothetical protein
MIYSVIMQFLSIKTHSKTHNMFFFIILSYVLLTNIILSEVITLIENKNITCVSSQDSVVYITPLMNTGLPLIEISENINDWIKTDSTNASFGPVTDQRWEGFPTAKFKGLVIQNTIRSFSIYSKTGLLYLTFNSEDFKHQESIYFFNKGASIHIKYLKLLTQTASVIGSE